MRNTPGFRLVFLFVIIFDAWNAGAQALPANDSSHALIRAVNEWRPVPRDVVQQNATQGKTDAMIALYFDYSDGLGVPQNGKVAMTWLITAAKTGNAYAQCLLGGCYEKPDMGCSAPNMPMAVQWYQRAADQGYSQGQDRLGFCYIDGKGVEQDEERGVEWVRRAADQGNVSALRDLASLYARGIGTPRNEQDRPLTLWEKVAVEGDPNEEFYPVAQAYDRIIYHYEFGIGTERDIVTAAAWYCRGFLKGLGYYTLADKVELATPKVRPKYEFSEGRFERSAIMPLLADRWSQSDPIYPALSLYLKSAKGNADAMTVLGDMYLNGEDVPVNPTKAWAWYACASKHGAMKAGPKMSKAVSRLSQAESLEARQLLADLIQQLNRVSHATF